LIRALGWAGVDGLLRLDAGRSAQGFCNVPLSLAVFDTHFPRLPVLPGMLVLDALVELAARCLNPQAPEVWSPAALERLRFREMVRPGDQLLLEVEVRDLTDSRATVSGSARVGDRVVTSIKRLEMERLPEG
jgi:3-hydroxyacyl-[acyl-carrier-protein] dehydratase